ncbi:hypothetical protein BCR43DRAFT_406586, partial [Syncephalastrum racemosum]
LEITNLTRNVTPDHIDEIFGQFGQIVKLDLPMNHKLRRNLGLAYVEYKTEEEMQKAISYMDKGQLDGKYLDVAVAPPP